MLDSSSCSDVWEAPDKQFSKTILIKGYGFYCPQDGSVCKIKVIIDESKILTDVNDDNIKELIVGDVDDPIERILEACVRTMKNEEICTLRFPDPLHPCKIKEEAHGIGVPEYMIELAEKDDVVKAIIGTNFDATIGTTVEDEDKLNEVQEISSDGLECESATEKVGDCKNDDSSTLQKESPTKETDDDVNKLAVQSSQETDSASEVSNPRVAELQEDITDTEGFEVQAPKVYEVQLQLISYTREPEIWEMSITEKWRRAYYHKQKGMELYSRGSYEWAFRRFSLALKYLISLEHDIPPGQNEEGMNIADLKLSCYLNLGACQMRHHNYPHVVKNCSKALELQASNSRALYRRGAAYIQLQEYEKAKEDLDKALVLEPKNQTIIKQQQLLKARVQKLNQYYAKAMKKMFS